MQPHDAHPRRILLIDDSRDEREMYAEWFLHLGYCTLQADTAADGYRLAVELTPDLIVADVALPGSENGLQLTRRLKENAATRSVPVVILTAHVFPVHRDAAASAGCDLFMTKPCAPEALADAVAQLVIQHVPSGGAGTLRDAALE